MRLVLCFPGVSPQTVQNMFKECVQKSGTLYEDVLTPLVHVLNTPLTDKQITELHMQCDCMVFPSYMFSAQSLPLEAAVFGNTPVITNGSGTAEILTDNNAWLIDSYPECCALPIRPFPDVFTSKETIRKPIIKSLAHCLEEAYKNKYLRDKKKANRNNLLQSLSYETVAEQLKDYICIQ